MAPFKPHILHHSIPLRSDDLISPGGLSEFVGPRGFIRTESVPTQHYMFLTFFNHPRTWAGSPSLNIKPAAR